MAFSSGGGRGGRGNDRKKNGPNVLFYDITHLSKDIFNLSDFPSGMEPGNRDRDL